jgi:leucyl-tRNA synthetase
MHAAVGVKVDHTLLTDHSVVIVLVHVQVSNEPPSREQLRLLHSTIKKVTVETEELRFNTAIAAMMEFINGVYKWDSR